MNHPNKVSIRIVSSWILPMFMVCLLINGDRESVAAAEETEMSSPSKSRQEITPESKRSIDQGFQWLLKCVRRNGVGPDIGLEPDLGCTAITGLALLSEGNTTTTGPHQRELRLVLDATLTMLRHYPEGHPPNETPSIVQRKIGLNADLFLAALFLTEVVGDAGYYEEDVSRRLKTLVEVISRAQQADGTWGSESWAPILGTVLGWESMRSASSCGMRVEGAIKLAVDAMLQNLREVDQQNASSWMHNFYKEASAIRVLYSNGYHDDDVFHETVDRLIQTARTDSRYFKFAGGEEYLSFFLVTECILQSPRAEAEKWFPLVRDNLIDVQNQDGSWTGHHCIINRSFCTAAALLTLQAPNRYLSISDH